MGCGLITKLELGAVARAIFVAPTAGNETEKLIERYGPEVREGKLTMSSDGLKKYISKAYFDSVQGIVWQEEYKKLLTRYNPVYVFESADEEIVGQERFALREMPFASYTVIPGAKHNLAGRPLRRLFTELDTLFVLQ